MNWEKNMYRGTLSNSNILLYMCPVNKRAAVQSIDIVNRDSSMIHVYIYLVPSGDTSGNGNVLLWKIPVPPGSDSTGELYSWRGFQVIDDTAGTLYGYADDGVGGTVDCTCHISGSERTVKVEKTVI